MIAATNFLSVRIYGEAEFWLSICKLITLLGLIILGIVITAGGGPTHESIGFRYWYVSSSSAGFARLWCFAMRPTLTCARCVCHSL